MTVTAAVTLFEDWTTRRQRLIAGGAPLGRAYIDAQVHILDYLLQRYVNTPEAAQPAHFPAPGEVYLNHRAMVVHHHLERDRAMPIKSEQQATDRASRILKRMAAQQAQAAIVAGPGSSENAPIEAASKPASKQRRMGFWQKRAWLQIGEAMRWGYLPEDVYTRINAAFQHGPTLPEVAVKYLSDRIELMAVDAGHALELLERCDNASAVDFAILAWQTRVSMNGDDKLAARMTGFFSQPERSTQAAEKVRNALASENSNVRIRAAEMLTKIGTLDDIGLLMDLLALPQTLGDDPREREALLEAIRKLSGEP